MTFDNLNTEAGLSKLNDYLADKSYVEGFEASQADVAVFEDVMAAVLKFPHLTRWVSHMFATKGKFHQLPGTKKAPAASAAAPAPAAKEEDDFDPFASESEDEEVARAKAERLAAYNAKKAAKGPGPVAKSSVVLDVKPWDDETDLAEMEKQVRAIELDGLLWGASKLVPIGYGIKKLQISCVIEDDKVGLDLINENIEGLDELVQSVDVVSFNKV